MSDRLFRSANKRGSFDLARLYLSTGIDGLRQRRAFAGVRFFCLFIGHPRSGHTLLGELLAAHPDALIGRELDVLSYVERGFRRDQLYQLIARNRREEEQEQGRDRPGHYSYRVPGAWQGRTRSIRVVGDKRGGLTTRRLMRDPALLGRLRRTVGDPIRIIHVVRNPYDNIATRYIRSESRWLRATIRRHVRHCEVIEAVRASCDPSEFHELRHEEMIAEPRQSLRRLLDFLELEVTDEFLEAAAGIVYASPNRSRFKIDWSDEAREDVAGAIRRFPSLAGYRFED